MALSDMQLWDRIITLFVQQTTPQGVLHSRLSWAQVLAVEFDGSTQSAIPIDSTDMSAGCWATVAMPLRPLLFALDALKVSVISHHHHTAHEPSSGQAQVRGSSSEQTASHVDSQQTYMMHIRQQAMSQQHTTPSDPSKLLAELLSSSLLILEVACLAFSKPATKHFNVAITEQLWSLAVCKAHELAKLQSQACAQSAVPDSSAAAEPITHTHSSVTHRSLCIIHFLIPALRSYIKASHLVQAEACCFMLKAVVTTQNTALHHTMVTEVLKLGGLAVMMQAFDVSRQAASTAYSILQCILRPGSMSPKMMALNMALVARMDGVHRCCRLLCPVLSPQEDVATSVVQKAYTPRWMPVSEVPAGQLDCLHGVASFVDHLLQAHPLSTPASDGSAVLDETAPTWKTPNACDWETIQSSTSKALATAVWLASAANRLQARQDPEHRRLCIRLKEQLYALVNHLISGHLLDPQLDMASLAGYAVGLLTEWQPESSSPSLSLLFRCDALNNLNTLLLRRMATDKALLGTHMDGDGTVAMPSCISTAMTCIDFCYLITIQFDNLSHPAANKFVEVLYAAMDSPHHCRYILSGAPQPEGFKKLDVLLSLHKAFKTPGDTHVMSGQLTVAACMAHMYRVDMDSMKGGDTGPHCAVALTDGVFDSILNLIQTAVLAPLPWPAEHCVALARVLWRVSQLWAKLPAALAQHQFHLHALMVVLLPKLRNAEVLPTLERQLLHAVLSLLREREAQPSNHDLRVQGYGTLLTDTLLQHGVCFTDKRGKAQPVSSTAAGYSSVGLPPDDAPLLTSKLLDLILEGKHQPGEWLHFAQVAVLPCTNWFLEFVQLSMQDRSPSFGSYIDLVRSCTTLIGRYHAQQQKGIACIPPLQATCALLQVLFPTINMLTGHHRQAVQAIQEQKHTEQVRGVIAKLQSLTDAVLEAVSLLQEQPKWAAALVQLQGGGWCPDTSARTAALQQVKSQLASLRRQHMLSKIVVQRVEDVLAGSPGTISGPSSEAAALQAAQQLCDEEEVGRAHAAAKQAKKQRQKLKKKQASTATQQEAVPSDIVQSASDSQHSPRNLPAVSADQPHRTASPVPDASPVLGAGTPCQQDSARPHQSPPSPARPSPSDPGNHFPQDCLPSAFQTSTPSKAALDKGDRRAHDDDTPHDAAHSSPAQLQCMTGNDLMAAEGVLRPRQPSDNVRSGGAMHRLTALHPHLCCPLTQELLKNPVIATDGYTYEKAALQQWLHCQQTSPVTGGSLDIRVVPNRSIKTIIAEVQLVRMQA